MRDSSERQITIDIDILIAIAGGIAGLQLTIWLAMTTDNRLYPIFAMFSFLACVTYLVLKWRLSSISLAKLLEEKDRKPLTYLLLNISFFALILCALMALVLRPELYSRPMVFFVSISLASAVLAAEILLLPPAKGYAYFILAKIVMVALILILTPQLIFPSLMGLDTYDHAQTTRLFLDSKHLVSSANYSSFPLMHLTSGITMLLADLDYRVATMLSTCSLYAIASLSFVFLLGRFIYNSKAGLLAALLLSCSTLFVHWGWWFVPNSYAIVFLPVLAFLLFKAREQHTFRLLVLVMLLMWALILTHTIGPVAIALVLFIFWLGHIFYNWAYRTRFKTPVTLILTILFGIAMFSWWIYSSPFAITSLQELIDYRFGQEYYFVEAEESSQYMITIPLWESISKNLANPILWAISFVGCLAAFSARFGNRYGFLLAVGGLALLSIGFFSLPLEIRVIPGRWHVASVFLLTIPAGFALVLIYGALREGARRVLILSLLVAVLTFISITNPSANIDNPMMAENTTIRYALKKSELQSVTTISNLYGNEVSTDDYYYIAGYTRPLGIPQLGVSLVSKDFSNQTGVVVIRKEIVERPFYFPGPFRLSYDPRELLREQGFSQIYDCGTVSAYMQMAE